VSTSHELAEKRMKMHRKRAIQPKTKSAVVAFVAFAMCLLGICNLSLAQKAASEASAKEGKTADQPSGSLVARGEYIVEGLSRCGQCHTPRDSNGKAEQSELLRGAAVWLKPAEPVEDWPLKAPRIAGIPPGTDAEMVKLLTTGIWRDGKPLRQPMPQFRMTQPDAEAVVAYLKSLQ
jgi:mono/diheme cytochrome c family protein